MIQIKDHNEAFSYVSDLNADKLEQIRKHLSVYFKNYQFMPKFRMGLHDGKKNFYELKGRHLFFPKGLGKVLYHTLLEEGVEATYEPLTYNDVKPTKKEFLEFVETLDLPFTPYEYQLRSAFASICNYRQINVMCTNAGKSMTQYIVLRYFLSKGLKTLLLVPRTMLVTQMYNDFKSYGWDSIDDYVTMISGDNPIESLDTPIIISTWQSLQNAEKTYYVNELSVNPTPIGSEFRNGEVVECTQLKVGNFTVVNDSVIRVAVKDLKNCKTEVFKNAYKFKTKVSDNLFSSLDALIVDEVHSAGGDSAEEGNIYERIILPSAHGARYRLGFTGTMPRDAVGKMILLSAFGKSITYVTTKELIEAGRATPVIIKAIFLEYPDEEKQEVRKIHAVKGLKPSQRYNMELEFISNFTRRRTLVAKLINKVTNTFGNSLVLFDKVEDGEQMCLETFRIKHGFDIDIKKLKVKNEYGIYFISGKGAGSNKDKIREEIRNVMEIETNSILFGTSSILSTGINIKNLHNLVFISGGKSFIKLNQSIGRMIRLHVSKTATRIWDIVDDFSHKYKKSKFKNYMIKQFEERVLLYDENEYDIDEKTIKFK